MEKQRFEKEKIKEFEGIPQLWHPRLLHLTYSMQDATTASREGFCGERVRAAGRGRHLTVKKGSSAAGSPLC